MELFTPISNAASGNRPVEELGDVRFPFSWDIRTERRLFSRLALNYPR
jgi:hypothetical protein